MKNQLEVILYLTCALAFTLAITQAWPVAVAFVASTFLLGAVKFIERKTENQTELIEQRMKALEDRMSGLSITRELRR